MANEIGVVSNTGLSLYAVLLNSAGQAWNGAAFEALNGANWATYDLPLTETVAGIYLGDMPAVSAGLYNVLAYEQAGASPATTDEAVARGEGYWGGATWVQQTGDAYAQVGIAGAGLTALGDTRIANLDATVSSRAVAGDAMALTGDYDAAKTAAQVGEAAAATAGLSTFAPATDEIETGITWTEWAKVLGAVLAGVASGGGTTTVVFKALDNAGTTRVTATVDTDGNRSAVTLNV